MQALDKTLWKTYTTTYDGKPETVALFLCEIEVEEYEPRFVTYDARHSVADPFVVHVLARKRTT